MDETKMTEENLEEKAGKPSSFGLRDIMAGFLASILIPAAMVLIYYSCKEGCVDGKVYTINGKTIIIKNARDSDYRGYSHGRRDDTVYMPTMVFPSW